MIDGKVILVTGGTGSYGEIFVELAIKEYNPKAVRVFSRGEYFQWEMSHKLNDLRLRYLIGDIRDRDRLHRAMGGVDIVVHAAALKHVPLCEYNPIEAVKTNIVGSINVIDAAIDNHVDKVIALSSDKAVHPINIYGATKLAMEKLFINSNVYGDTKFSCVRFGNFWASRGSVIPLFAKQAEEGEITVTDPDMTRFWITLEDAARFTIQCIGKMEGKEIFVPKMDNANLSDLIKKYFPEAKRKVIGKREGEKVKELMFGEGEKVEDCGDYYLIRG